MLMVLLLAQGLNGIVHIWNIFLITKLEELIFRALVVLWLAGLLGCSVYRHVVSERFSDVWENIAHQVFVILPGWTARLRLHLIIHDNR